LSKTVKNSQPVSKVTTSGSENFHDRLTISREKVLMIKRACTFLTGSFSAKNLTDSLYDFINNSLAALNPTLHEHYHPVHNRPDGRTLMRALGEDKGKKYVSLNQNIFLEALFDCYIEKFKTLPGVSQIIGERQSERAVGNFSEDDLHIFSESTYIDVGYVDSTSFNNAIDYIYLDQLYVTRNVEAILHEKIDPSFNKYRIVFISGDAGFGKSSLLWNLYRHYHDNADYQVMFLKSAYLSDYNINKIILSRKTLQGKQPLIFVDTLDLLLYNSSARDAVIRFLLAVKESNGICIATSRPQELATLRPLLPRETVCETLYLDAYDEATELPKAIKKYAGVYARSMASVEQEELFSDTLKIISGDRSLKNLCLNPLTLRMLFSLYAPLNLPNEINVFQLYSRYWENRVEFDGRSGNIDSQVATLNLSKAATALATAMLAKGAITLSRESNIGLAALGVTNSDINYLISRGVLKYNATEKTIEFFHQTFFEHAAARAVLSTLKDRVFQLCEKKTFLRNGETNFFIYPIYEQVLVLSEGHYFDLCTKSLIKLISSKNIDKIRCAIYAYCFFSKEHHEASEIFNKLIRNLPLSDYVIVNRYLACAANTSTDRLLSTFKLLDTIWRRGVWREQYHVIDLLDYYSVKSAAATLAFLRDNKVIDALLSVQNIEENRKQLDPAMSTFIRSTVNLYSIDAAFVFEFSRRIIALNEPKIHSLLFKNLLSNRSSRKDIFVIETLFNACFGLHKHTLFENSKYLDNMVPVIADIFCNKWMNQGTPLSDILSDIRKEANLSIASAKNCALGKIAANFLSDYNTLTTYFEIDVARENLFKFSRLFFTSILSSARTELLTVSIKQFRNLLYREKQHGGNVNKNTIDHILVSSYIGAFDKIDSELGPMADDILSDVLNLPFLIDVHPKVGNLLVALYRLKSSLARKLLSDGSILANEFETVAVSVCTAIVESERRLDELYELSMTICLRYRRSGVLCTFLKRVANDIGLFPDESKCPDYVKKLGKEIFALSHEFASSKVRDEKVDSAHLLYNLLQLRIVDSVDMPTINLLYPKSSVELLSWIVELYPFCVYRNLKEFDNLLNACRNGFAHSTEKIRIKSEKSFLLLMCESKFNCARHLDEILSIYIRSNDHSDFKTKILGRMIANHAKIDHGFAFDLFYKLITSDYLNQTRKANENEVMHELRYGCIVLCRNITKAQFLKLVDLLKTTGCEYGKMMIDGLSVNENFEINKRYLIKIKQSPKTPACIKNELTKALQHKTKTVNFVWSELLNEII
jgi:hypothetical protein